MNETENFSVDVIYALPKQQKIISVMVSPGTTFIEAVKQSDMVKFFPDINL
jgi:putative ubiquitin-RnfH superfamily antitoxin RatB of RatAB toxin-antitoxin module